MSETDHLSDVQSECSSNGSNVRPTVSNQKKVLVIYTGGTIGMTTSSKGVLEPKVNVFSDKLRNSDQFHDHTYNTEQFGTDDKYLVLPYTNQMNRIGYKIEEYNPLLDSSNMNYHNYIQIAKDIEKYYRDFDGFVILHGTDTMCYTASVLSFMIENLGKPIVITGSQISLFESRTDGRENLLNSLIIAGNYCIPEVTILFGNKLFRGNRTTKLSAQGFNAFDSPNMMCLANLATDIKIEWNHLYRCPKNWELNVQTDLNKNISLIELHPWISADSVRALISAPIEGVVLKSYGAGNCPTNRTDILDLLEDAVKRGVIIVNITQCISGEVTPIYETGNVLKQIGIIPGYDMTTEACLTKLSYVLSKTNWNRKQREEAIKNNIRGELTTHFEAKYESKDLIQAVAQTLNLSESHIISELNASVNPAVVCAFAANVLLKACIQLGIDLSAPDYYWRTALHSAAANGHTKLVEYLIKEGLDINATDYNNETPIQLALKHNHRQTVALLKKYGSVGQPQPRYDSWFLDRLAVGPSRQFHYLIKNLELVALNDQDQFKHLNTNFIDSMEPSFDPKWRPKELY